MSRSRKRRQAELLNNYHKIKKDAFYFDRIERYFLRSDKTNYYQVISDKTYQDLDLDEVFMFIDRTSSKVGQQYYYHLFRTIPHGQERCARLEKLIQRFEEDRTLRESVVTYVAKLNTSDAYNITTLIFGHHIQKPAWFWVVPVLSLLSVSSLLSAFFFPPLILLSIFILMVNYFVHYWNKNNLLQYSGSISQLLLLNQVAKEIQQLTELREQDLRTEEATQTIDRMRGWMSIFKFEARLQTEVGQALEVLVEISKALFLIEPLILFSVLQKLDSKRPQIHQLYCRIGELDVAISIASLRKGLPYHTRPQIIREKKLLVGTEVYHPLLDSCVANSIELRQKSALLTGSNMSGKTTFIRTIGINAILGQAINVCFAREFTMSPLRVHSAIRLADDLVNDKSYYFEEVVTIKQMLEESRSSAQNLFLLDEMFKGTNTVERIAAGKSVLTYLNNQDNIVLISTHDLKLSEYLRETYSLYHFTEVVENGTISFDYKIKAGNLKTTNAIRILELNDYPPEVIAEAKELSEQISQEKGTNPKLQSE